MQNKSTDKHILADRSTAHVSLKKMMEDSNQDIEFAKDQEGQSELETEMRIGNSANIRHQLTRNTITAGLFNNGFLGISSQAAIKMILKTYARCKNVLARSGTLK